MRRAFWTVLTLIGLAALSGSAAAETSRTDRNRAQQEFERGMELIEQESWEQALAAFDESLRIYPTQTALYNRAVCLGLMGNPVEAVDAFGELLERYRETINADRRNRAEEELARLQRRIGRVNVRVDGAESATLFVDGDEAGRTPLTAPLAVNPGRHQLEARAPDMAPATRWIEVGAGGSIDVVLALSATGGDGDGDGDGGEGGAGPGTGAGGEGGEGLEPAASGGRGARIGAWVSSGVAVAALGTALGLFLWNRNQFDTWETEDAAIRDALTAGAPPEGADLESRLASNADLQETIDTVSIVSWVMLGVGSAAAVSAVVLFIVAPRLDRRGQVSLLPSPGGLVLAGRW